MPDPDAALINLCNDLIDNLAERSAILSDRHRARRMGLSERRREIVTALDGKAPTTPEGARAMARAAMARLPRDSDGNPCVDDGADQLLVRLAQYIAGADRLADLSCHEEGRP